MEFENSTGIPEPTFEVGQPPYARHEAGEPMSFKDVMTRLGIEDYGERIFNSNSHGELMHLMDYVELAQAPTNTPETFRPKFLAAVALAKDWSSPAHCYQHILELLNMVEYRAVADAEFIRRLVAHAGISPTCPTPSNGWDTNPTVLKMDPERAEEYRPGATCPKPK